MNGRGRVHHQYDLEDAEDIEGVVRVVQPGTGCVVSYLAHDGNEAVVVDLSQYVDRYLNAADKRDLENVTELADSEMISVGDREFEVFHMPRHTPGSVSFRFGDALLSGDTLFLRSVGRPDLKDGDEEAFVEMIVESLADEPANYNEIKQINLGK